MDPITPAHSECGSDTVTYSWLPTRNNGGQKAVGQHIQGTEIKKNQGSYTEHNYFPKLTFLCAHMNTPTEPLSWCYILLVWATILMLYIFTLELVNTHYLCFVIFSWPKKKKKRKLVIECTNINEPKYIRKRYLKDLWTRLLLLKQWKILVLLISTKHFKKKMFIYTSPYIPFGD